jgi:LacI family transcriptional regulator
MNRLPTLEDVALRAGVSKSTVSRVLNNSAKISEETRARVLDAARELNYEPNIIARSLSKNKTFTIGVILEDILNPFFSAVAKGIETALRISGYSMILTSSDFDHENELKLVRMLIQYKVDGILLTPVDHDGETVTLLKERGLPFFIMNSRSKDKEVSWIDSDNFQGGLMATRHLIGLGHRGFLCLRHMAIDGSRLRFEGFKAAVLEAGLKMQEQVVLGDAHSRRDGYDLICRFIDENGTGSMPSAVIAVNDTVAIGAIEALLERGLSIPERVSVIGYDDINISALIRVPLTTIHQPKFRMGEIAASQLVDKIERGERGVARQFLIQPRLVERDSCQTCGVLSASS